MGLCNSTMPDEKQTHHRSGGLSAELQQQIDERRDKYQATKRKKPRSLATRREKEYVNKIIERHSEKNK